MSDSITSSAPTGYRPEPRSSLQVPRASTDAFIALFALLLFGVSSLRAWLADARAFHLLETGRLAGIALGTLFFAWTITRLARRAGEPLGARVRPVVADAALVAALVLSAQLLVAATHLGWGARADMVQTARWLVAWTGYYLAGCAAFLVVQCDRLASATRRVAAAHPERAEARAEAPDALWIELNRRRVRVAIDEVEWVEAERDYIRVHAGGRSGLIRMTLASAERTLACHGFVRVHRSALCRKEAITAVSRSDTGAVRARLTSGDEVPVGRSYRPMIARLMGRPIA